MLSPSLRDKCPRAKNDWTMDRTSFLHNIVLLTMSTVLVVLYPKLGGHRSISFTRARDLMRVGHTIQPARPPEHGEGCVIQAIIIHRKAQPPDRYHTLLLDTIITALPLSLIHI